MTEFPQSGRSTKYVTRVVMVELPIIVSALVFEFSFVLECILYWYIQSISGIILQ